MNNIHDMIPYPPAHIVPESRSGRDSRAQLTRDICIAQNVVIGDLHRQLRAMEAQLRLAELRAECAAARADELERQHEELLLWVAEAERLLADTIKPRRESFWRRLLRRRGHR